MLRDGIPEELAGALDHRIDGIGGGQLFGFTDEVHPRRQVGQAQAGQRLGCVGSGGDKGFGQIR